MSLEHAVLAETYRVESILNVPICRSYFGEHLVISLLLCGEFVFFLN